jgi:tRNA A37 threonylcarbamoyladenosine dehydratase
MRANRLNIPIISSMGTGNKLDPTRFEVTDIYNTTICPLAKVMRKELKARGIKKLKVVYSKEQPIKPQETEQISCKTNCVCPPGIKRKCTARNQVPGSISFVPSVAGLIIAGEVIKDIIS